MKPEYIIFASGGNDSVALVQWAHERVLSNVAVVYSNTGWAADFWPARMERFGKWVARLGFQFIEIAAKAC